MKVKKVSELVASEYSEEQLKDFRKRQFVGFDDTYNIYGENLSYNIPEYSKLTTLYSEDDCITWYNNEKNNKFSRIHKFDNIIFVKKSESTEILDKDLLLNSKKYNI